MIVKEAIFYIQDNEYNLITTETVSHFNFDYDSESGYLHLFTEDEHKTYIVDRIELLLQNADIVAYDVYINIQ